MKNAKRLLLFILTLCVLAFSACAGEEAKNDNSGDSSANSVNTPSAEESADASLDKETESGSEESSEDGGETAPVPVSATPGLTWVNPRYEGEAYYTIEHAIPREARGQHDLMDVHYYVIGENEWHEGLLDDEDAVYATTVSVEIVDTENNLATREKVVADLEDAGAYVEMYFTHNAAADTEVRVKALRNNFEYRGPTEEEFDSENIVYYQFFATAKQMDEFKKTAENNEAYSLQFLFPVRTPDAMVLEDGHKLDYENSACGSAYMFMWDVYNGPVQSPSVE